MSHWARRIGFTCSMEMMSSLKVVSALEAFGLVGLRFFFLGESSMPRAYWVELMAFFLPISVWISASRACASSPIVRIPAPISFFSDAFPRNNVALAYRKRPHFFGDFFWEQSVCITLFGFSEIRCHFGQEFICGDSNIDGKSKLLVNPVLDFVRRRNRVRIQKGKFPSYRGIPHRSKRIP